MKKFYSKLIRTNLILYYVIYLFSSCASSSSHEYQLTIVTSTQLAEKESDLLHDDIKTFLQFSFCNDANTIFIPKVYVFRSDLADQNKEEIIVPTGLDNIIKKKMGTYGFVDMQNDYTENLPTMKAGSFLSKKGTKKTTPYLYKRNALTFELGDNSEFKSSQILKKQIDSLICLNYDYSTHEIVIFLKSEESITIPFPPTETYPCKNNTTANAIDLKEDIENQILNTTKSYNLRLSNAEKIWKTYFDENAYVALYSSPKESTNNVWDPGSGLNYFTDRLALLESIVGVSIFKVEYANNGKVSGLHIVECHNSSELISGF